MHVHHFIWEAGFCAAVEELSVSSAFVLHLLSSTPFHPCTYIANSSVQILLLEYQGLAVVLPVQTALSEGRASWHMTWLLVVQYQGHELISQHFNLH